MILQRRRAADESIAVLGEGRRRFPANDAIALCLAVSLMHAGDFGRALTLLAPLDRDPQALRMGIACHRALGDSAAAARWQRRLDRLEERPQPDKG